MTTKKITKQDVISSLYNAYKKENRRLDKEEIKSIKSIPSLRIIYNRLELNDLDSVWELIEKIYGFPNYKEVMLEKQKQDFAKILRDKSEEIGKTAGRRDFVNESEMNTTAKKLFGSWNEAVIYAGIKPKIMYKEFLTDLMKDKVLEALMIFSVIHNRVIGKTSSYKIKNGTNSSTIETFTGKTWEEIVSVEYLDLMMENEATYKKLKDRQLIDLFIKSKKKVSKSNSLLEYYSKKNKEDMSFIYIIKRMGITWDWLMNMNLKVDIKEDDSLVFDRNMLLDVLALKYKKYGRGMKSFEINDDITMPSVMQLTITYDASITKIWEMAEARLKELI